MLTLGGSAYIARPPDRVVPRYREARLRSSARAAKKFCPSSGAFGIQADAASHERGAERDSFVLSRRAFGPSIAATLLAPIIPSNIGSAFAAGGGGSPAAAGVGTVVIKPFITPTMAANYLVEAVPGLVKRDDAPVQDGPLSWVREVSH